MLTRTTGTSKLKTTLKICALALAFALCFAAPFNAFAAKVTKSIYTKTNLTHNSRFDKSIIVNGIDISSWQGDIDFKKIKKTDTKVIIIRVGVRGWGEEGTLMKDKKFNEYMEAALANGFEVGVYLYSQALNETEAKEEAKFVLKNIKGYDFTLPVFYDYEFAGTAKGRLDSAWKNKEINKSQMTKNALAFCQTIEKEGYKAGVYASKSFFEDQLDRTQLENDYAIWLAHYTTKTSYAGKYQLWQYAGGDPDGSNGAGKVSGIDGYVDANFIYYDVLTPLLSKGFEIETIKKQEYTGKEVRPVFSVYHGGKELVKGEDYYVTFENNIEIGTAKVTVTGINKYEGFTQVSKEFSIVPPEVTGLRLEERGENSLKVSWDKNEYAKKYYIQVHRKEGWIKAGTTKETSFEIGDLATATNYKIRVRAYKKVGDVNYFGNYGNEFETATAPSKPTKLKVSAATPVSLKLTWKKQSNASYYEVYMYNSESKKYNFIKKAKSGTTNYATVNDLSPNKKYKFKVRAYKKSKDGAFLSSAKSDALTAYTSPEIPEIISAKSNAQKRISVNWNKVSGVTGYRVMWSTTKDFSSNYKSVDASKNSTVLTTAQSNKKYYVKVRAYKIRNDKRVYSPWSKTLSVKTK